MLGSGRVRPCGSRNHRTFDLGGADLPQPEFATELFHDRQAEIRLLGRGILNVAIGLVNAHQLRARLQFFLSEVHKMDAGFVRIGL